MRDMRKKLLSMATSLALFGGLTAAAPVAFAQDQDQSESGNVLEEITVVARKREENIQDVPVAITAVGAQTIDNLGLRGLSDISKVTAGLTFESEFGRGANRPVIRGQANILGASGVSYFIDGVYIQGSIDDYDINDVERIEVVKGPQSALYGRNTYSGAINIITKGPGDEFGGRFDVRYGEDNEYNIFASVRGPMTERLSGSISVRTYNLDGPFTNVYDGSDIGERETNSVSGVLDWQGDNWQVRFRAYASSTEDGQAAIFGTHTDDNDCGGLYTDNGSLYGGRERYTCGVVKAGPINTDWSRQAPDARSTSDILQTSLAISGDLTENWSFTSITGYNERDDVLVTDGDYLPTSFQVSNFTPTGFPFDFSSGFPFGYAYVGEITDFTFASSTEGDDWSQEFRFAFDYGRLSGLLGAFYFEGDDSTRDIRELPPEAGAIAGANFFAELQRMQGVCAANPACAYIVPFFGPGVTVPRDQNDLNIKNTALFGMVAYDISDAWRITGEARWADEKIKQNTIVRDLGDPSVETSSADASFSSFSPRVTVDWKFSDTSMLYALYAEGSKPGGFNGTVAIEAGVPTYDEEDVKSFEIGNKNLFLDGQLMFNVAAYFNQIEGYQLTQNVRSGVNTTSAIDNVGDVDVYGAEFELMYRPINLEGLTLTANYAYNKSEFTEGRDQNQGVLNDALDDNLINCSTGFEFPEMSDQACSTTSNPPVYGSIKGKRLPRSPKHQFFFDADFRQPFANGSWEWFVGANYFYDSSKYAQVHNLAETGDTQLVNARIGVNNENWTFQAFGRNLTGEDSSPAVLRYAMPNAFTRNFAVSARRDSYWGVQAIYQF